MAENVVVTRLKKSSAAWKGALFWTSAASIVGGLLLWELVGRFVVKKVLFLTTPTQIVVEIVRLARNGELQQHILVSAAEFSIGVVFAIFLGIGVGFAMASNKFAKRALGPWVAAFYATPTIAISPLIILWAGIDIWSKVIVVVINSIFPMIINTEAGLRSTDRQLIDAARCFGCSRLQIFWKVSLPSAVPFVFAGIKLAIGRGLVAVVVAELFGSRAGLGFLLAQASDAFNMPLLFVAVTILAVTGMTLTWLVGMLERLLMPWRTAVDQES
ncbi:MAG: nitrate transporter permease [Xanthobacteraceae bacterium]|nr:nitrate transporter permease [Xanthobacteraceae bacterium]